MKNVLLLMCLAVALSLCACCEFGLIFGEEGYGRKQPKAPTSEYLAYLEHVKAQPLDFQIPASDDAAAWKRAHEILKKYGRDTFWCARKFTISSDDVLEKGVDKHYHGKFEDIGYLFRIVRGPAGNMTNYAVRFANTVAAADWDGDLPPNKAHAQVIAYYISSGKIMKQVWDPYYFEKLLK